MKGRGASSHLGFVPARREGPLTRPAARPVLLEPAIRRRGTLIWPGFSAGLRILDLTNVAGRAVSAAISWRSLAPRSSRSRRRRPAISRGQARRRPGAQPPPDGRIVPGAERWQAFDHAQSQASPRPRGVHAPGRDRRIVVVENFRPGVMERAGPRLRQAQGDQAPT